MSFGHHHFPHRHSHAPAKNIHQHHDPAGHVHHGERPRTTRFMLYALFLTALFAVVEAVVGWWSGSLALISDAGHMVSDALSLMLGTFAVWIGKSPPTQRHSYGLQRAEVIAAFLNGILLLVVISAIVYEAFSRIRSPVHVHGIPVIVVALLGMLLNGVNGWMISRMEQGLNTRAAMIHVVGDFMGSLAALVAGLVVWLTGWTPIDPLLSLVVAVLMLYSTIRILSDSVHVLMEGVPDGVSLNEVGEKLLSVEGVSSIHDLHIWTLTSGLLALSAHLEVADLEAWPGVLVRVQDMLKKDHGIDHVTLQPEIRSWSPVSWNMHKGH